MIGSYPTTTMIMIILLDDNQYTVVHKLLSVEGLLKILESGKRLELINAYH